MAWFCVRFECLKVWIIFAYSNGLSLLLQILGKAPKPGHVFCAKRAEPAEQVLHQFPCTQSFAHITARFNSISNWFFWTNVFIYVWNRMISMKMQRRLINSWSLMHRRRLCLTVHSSHTGNLEISHKALVYVLFDRQHLLLVQLFIWWISWCRSTKKLTVPQEPKFHPTRGRRTCPTHPAVPAWTRRQFIQLVALWFHFCRASAANMSLTNFRVWRIYPIVN